LKFAQLATGKQRASAGSQQAATGKWERKLALSCAGAAAAAAASEGGPLWRPLVGRSTLWPPVCAPTPAARLARLRPLSRRPLVAYLAADQLITALGAPVGTAPVVAAAAAAVAGRPGGVGAAAGNSSPSYRASAGRQGAARARLDRLSFTQSSISTLRSQFKSQFHFHFHFYCHLKRRAQAAVKRRGIFSQALSCSCAGNKRAV